MTKKVFFLAGLFPIEIRLRRGCFWVGDVDVLNNSGFGQEKVLKWVSKIGGCSLLFDPFNYSL